MKFFIVLFLFLTSLDVNAETIVRMELQLGATRNNVDLKLFNSAAPETVNSFLDYTDTLPIVTIPPTPTESYTNSFIHRISTGLLVDGGGFTYTLGSPFSCTSCLDANDESSFIFPGGLQPVTADLQIPLEFKKSNIRGTITMRKFLVNIIDPDKPVRASNWFINLSDNSALLDEFNFIAGGPYTAFGEVINNTMQIVDALETNPELIISDRADIHFDFDTLPLINYTAPDEIMQENLVRINSIKKLFSISSNVSAGLSVDTDFGIVLLNTNNQATIIITNLGIDDLSIISIANLNNLDVPFNISLLNNNCSGALLIPSSSCTFVVEFNSSVDGEFTDVFNIEFEFGDSVGIERTAISYSYSLSGRSSSVIQPFIITSIDDVSFGSLLVDSVDQLSVFIKNTGTEELVISSIDKIGENASDFQEITDCITASPIGIEGTCEIITAFSPSSLGEKLATLIVNSNAPNQPALSIPLSGFGDKDSDGIILTIEEAAPNKGDFNGDGIIDSQQDNVASFVTLDNEYISLVSDTNFKLKNIILIPESELGEFPGDVRFLKGAFSFDVELSQIGVAIEIGIVLPSDNEPQSYYLFGSTEDNGAPHWYEYAATQAIGKVTLTTPTGVKLKRNIIKLVVQDGGVGDVDGISNGRIVIGPGAPAYPLTKNRSNGAVHISLLILLVALMLLLRLKASIPVSRCNFDVF